MSELQIAFTTREYMISADPSLEGFFRKLGELKKISPPYFLLTMKAEPGQEVDISQLGDSPLVHSVETIGGETHYENSIEVESWGNGER